MNNFYQQFFETPANEVSTAQFKDTILQSLKVYVYGYEKQNTSPILNDVFLNQWYHSEGQEILISLFEKLWKKLDSLSISAMPSHDARHAIYKVPASALELIEAENLTGWERVGILGALMHDWGRWSEERIFGAPQGGSTHSRMSFVLAKEFLDDFEIPQEIKWHILNSVLVHTKGAVESDPMVAKITVTADREQLWGPEFVLRLMHHVKVPGMCECIYPDGVHSDIFSKIERIFSHRLLGPLHSRNEHLRGLKSTTAQFLYLAGTDDFKTNIVDFMENSQSWLYIDYQRLISQADSFTTHIKCPGQALKIFLDAKNIAPNKVYIKSAIERVLQTPSHLHERLAKAIMWSQEKKVEEEQRIKSSLNTLVKTYKDDKFLSLIANTLHIGI